MIDKNLSEVYKVGDATCNITPCTEKGLESENIKWVTVNSKNRNLHLVWEFQK